MNSKNIRSNQSSILTKDLAWGKVSLTQKAQFAKNLSVMQRSGLTIVESLEIILDSTTGKLKKVLQIVLQSVRSGNTLSASLARHPKVFSGIFVSATFAGESSGTLPENLEILAEQLQKEKELSAKIKGAMLYPMVVLVAAFALGMGISFFILPKIVPLFEGFKTDLPLTTRWLISFSHLIENYGRILFVSVISFIILLGWITRQRFSRPVTHWLLIKIPIIKNIVINANLARFSRTLGTLLKSGLNIDEALKISEKTLANYYYQQAINIVGASVSQGLKLSDNLALQKSLFPKMAIKMIYVGEQSGRLEETLLYLASYYEIEVDNATKNLSTAIEPLLLIFIGLVVGFLALSIITPIYNITGAIKK